MFGIETKKKLKLALEENQKLKIETEELLNKYGTIINFDDEIELKRNVIIDLDKKIGTLELKLEKIISDEQVLTTKINIKENDLQEIVNAVEKEINKQIQITNEISKASDVLTKLKAQLVESEVKRNAINSEIEETLKQDKQKRSEWERVHQERSDAQHVLQTLNDKYKRGLELFSKLEKEINLYEDTLEIGSFGLYTPQFDFQTSQDYKNNLEYNYEKQKQLIRNDQAAICNTEWTVGGSKTEGRKMTNQYKKLMLFAFNGECDSSIAKVKWNNAAKTRERIDKSFESVNKLGISQNVHLSVELLKLKFEELALVHEYEIKVHAEKEEQRRIRELMREEEKAQKEFERAQKEAEDEERRFQKALEKAKSELSVANQQDMQQLNNQIQSLEVKLKEAQERKERAISLAQQTKVGHIYVISNIGSFGEDVYKIGLTRRLDPFDRVKELGDASVPFQFDVHAIIYSENAPQLEYELHRKFAERRLNRINGRKEFFKVSLEEIEEIVKQHSNAEIQFTKLAEAKEYRETLTLIEKMKKSVTETIVTTAFPSDLN